MPVTARESEAEEPESQVEVVVVDVPEARRFEARVDGQVAGFLTYRSLPERMVLIHTEVDPAFQGKGVGSRLVSGVLDQVRDRGLMVTPRCPFVRTFLGRNHRYDDLVEASPGKG